MLVELVRSILCSVDAYDATVLREPLWSAHRRNVKNYRHQLWVALLVVTYVQNYKCAMTTTNPASSLRLLLLCVPLLLLTACGDEGDFNEAMQPRLADPRPNVVVIFTDDQGFADLGVHNQLSDIRTPNIDALAQSGVLFRRGYVTAPQCVPSRAAMISGNYQQRFGVDDNRYTPMPLSVTTLGQRFQSLGYATGMAGKWHLEVDDNSLEWFAAQFPGESPKKLSDGSLGLEVLADYYPNRRGYTDTYFGYHHQYWTTFDTDGNTRAEQFIQVADYRVDAVTDASVAFIARHRHRPFYLHVAHFAPHVPLVAAQQYLDRFPGDMKNRRRYALAMMSAIDDGVGRILSSLDAYGLRDNTLVFFISDNGAPLGMLMNDAPVEDRSELWNGSLNLPLLGEKGMLTEGGIRVPFIASWPAKVDAGQAVDEPVMSLDAAYTALKSAGAPTDMLATLDGVDLLPAMRGNATYLSQRPLFWRFWSQEAVLEDGWKYLRLGDEREFLFDLKADEVESHNLIASYPDKVAALRSQLQAWTATLQRPRETAVREQERQWYQFYSPPGESEEDLLRTNRP